MCMHDSYFTDRLLIIINYILAFSIGITMAAGSKWFVGLYNLSPEVSGISRSMLIAHVIGLAVWPLSFTLPYTLRASFDAKFTMTVSVLSMWIFRIGFGYLFILVFHMNVIGVWFAMFIDWIVRAVVFSWRFRGFGKRKIADI